MKKYAKGIALGICLVLICGLCLACGAEDSPAEDVVDDSTQVVESTQIVDGEEYLFTEITGETYKQVIVKDKEGKIVSNVKYDMETNTMEDLLTGETIEDAGAFTPVIE